VLAGFLCSSVSFAKEVLTVSEDELIIRGLLFEEYDAYEHSRSIFAQLFDDTGAEVYLFKEVNAAIVSNTEILSSIKRLEKWDREHPHSLEARRLLIPLYLSARNISKAKREAFALLELSQREEDLELASKSFMYMGEFQKAVELLMQLYRQTNNEEVLLRLSMVMDEYTYQRKKALQLLETHRRMYSSSEALYLQLIALYMKERNVEGMIEGYKAIYALTTKEEYLRKLIDTYGYKDDLESAISYLESIDGGKAILYELYKIKEDFQSAFTLTEKMYQEEGDVRWLAERAIMLFEKSEDKDNTHMLKEVVRYFEKALKAGVDESLYLNYYGYTLIDKDLNISRGIEMIQLALKQQPDNTYYLDSLAWGYYKQKECEKAYSTMEKVVEIEGLEIKEIKEHWQAIQACQ
jgi:tetratricopeptide (TPR) repeat protein